MKGITKIGYMQQHTFIISCFLSFMSKKEIIRFIQSQIYQQIFLKKDQLLKILSKLYQNYQASQFATLNNMNNIKIKPKNNPPDQSSSSIPVKLINGKPSMKKQKNVPAQIWAKRNILKKLTLQLKFNKNQTSQLKMIRTQLQCTFPEGKLKNEKKITEKGYKNKETFPSSNQRYLIQVSNSKVGESMKHLDPFYPIAALPNHGLKSYHIKSLSFQGNNFINVSKAVISEKGATQKNYKALSNRKLSLSYRQQDSESISNKKYIRPCSATQINVVHDNFIRQNNNQSFLKVSTKKMHFNTYQNEPCKANKQSSIIHFKRVKAETINDFHFPFQKRKSSLDDAKLTLKRPKSCIVKAKNTIDFTTCEAWNTKNSARQSQQNFPGYFQ